MSIFERLLPRLIMSLGLALSLGSIELSFFHEPSGNLGIITYAMMLLGLAAVVLGRRAIRSAINTAAHGSSRADLTGPMASTLASHQGGIAFGVFAFGIFCALLATIFALGGIYLVGLAGGMLLSLVGATWVMIAMITRGLSALKSPRK